MGSCRRAFRSNRELPAAARPQDRHGEHQGYRPRGGRPAARGMVRCEDCRAIRSEKYSPRDEAAAFAAALGRDVKAVEVPRAEWEQRFRREGMQHPEARIRMLDG